MSHELTCPNCGKVRTVKRLRSTTTAKCRSCKANPKVITCIECGAIRNTTSVGAGRCKDCYNKDRSANKKGKTFEAKCIDCGGTRVILDTTINRQAKRCHSCAAKLRVKVNGMPKRDKQDKMRYFRLCEKCGDIREVKSNQSAKKKLCQKCKAIHIGNKLRGKPKRVSPEAIARARKINAEHRQKVAEEQARKGTPEQERSDKEMIADWLAHNTVKVLGDVTPIEEVHVIGGIKDDYSGY